MCHAADWETAATAARLRDAELTYGEVGRTTARSRLATITAFSRPAILLARAAGPAGRIIQRRITGRYLRA
jgi:hypothetical protein